MDVLLNQMTHQAMNYAIRSGIAITSGYAIKQCGRLLKEAPRSKEREELARLQLRLESKIRVISPSIDMIDLIAARGNTSLESAVSLTKDIRFRIQRLAVRLSSAANEEERRRQKLSEETDRELGGIILEIKSLLAQIEDAVPLISLAITTSGINLSTKLSGSVSPSRLLQASTFLTAADTKYTIKPYRRQQVGPSYTLTIYMLFAGHLRPTEPQGLRETTWKEVLHKSQVKFWRVPLDELHSLPGERMVDIGAPLTIPADSKSVEFAYQLVLVEDLDDDRVHTIEDEGNLPGSIDGVSKAGIRDVIPIHQISKVFYADTGKILNIGGDGDLNNPVLLLKRDIEAEPPRRMLQPSQVPEHLKQHNSTWRLPPDLDPEWIALEVYSEQSDSDSEDEELPTTERSDSVEPHLTDGLSRLVLDSSPLGTPSVSRSKNVRSSATLSPSSEIASAPAIKTNLSLLEMLVKLTALQQFRQESHLSIEDELLNFFLEESGTAGAGTDKDKRQRIRRDAVHRVGFDPYDESPIKRRGEDYIQHANHSPVGLDNYDASSHHHFLPWPEFTRSSVGTPPSAKTSASSPPGALAPQLQTPSRPPTRISIPHSAPEPAKGRSSISSEPAETPSNIGKHLPVTPSTQVDNKSRSPHSAK